MKKILLVFSMMSLQSYAFAETYLGKIGPFFEGESHLEVLNLAPCKASKKELKLYVEQSGKYHIPRIKFDFAIVTYESNAEEVFNGKNLGEVRGFTIEFDPKKGCPKMISLKATAAGFNPGQINSPYVEVWMN